MSLLTYFSTIVTTIFIYDFLKEKFKTITHHIALYSVVGYFKTGCAYKKDIDHLKMVFKLPFVPFNIYKHMSKRCIDLYNLGKNNSVTTKKNNNTTITITTPYKT